MDKQTPEMIAKVMALRADGATQMEIAELLGMTANTVRKLDRHTSIPLPGDSEPDQLKREWFGVLARRIRVAVGNEDDAATADLIRAGAALITACEGTCGIAAAEHRHRQRPAPRGRKSRRSSRPQSASQWESSIKTGAVR